MPSAPKPKRFQRGTPIATAHFEKEVMLHGKPVRLYETQHVGVERRNPIKETIPADRRKTGRYYFQRMLKLRALRSKLVARLRGDMEGVGDRIRRTDDRIQHAIQNRIYRDFMQGRRKRGAFRPILKKDIGRSINPVDYTSAQTEMRRIERTIERARKRVPNRTRGAAIYEVLKEDSFAFLLNPRGGMIGIVAWAGGSASDESAVTIVYNPITRQLRWMSTTRLETDRPFTIRKKSFEFEEPRAKG